MPRPVGSAPIRFRSSHPTWLDASRVATRYEVLTEHKLAQQARELLTAMDPMRAAIEAGRAQVERARAAGMAAGQ